MKLIRPTTLEIFINISPKEVGLFDSFVYAPATAEELKLGHLFIVGEMRSSLPQFSYFLNFLAAFLKREFYSLHGKPAETALQAIFQKANARTEYFLVAENPSLFANLHVLAAVISGRKLIGGYNGEINGFVFKHGSTVHITNQRSPSSSSQNDASRSRIFSFMMSGDLDNEDIIVFCTNTLMEELKRLGFLDRIARRELEREKDIKRFLFQHRFNIKARGILHIINCTYGDAHQLYPNTLMRIEQHIPSIPLLRPRLLAFVTSLLFSPMQIIAKISIAFFQLLRNFGRFCVRVYMDTRISFLHGLRSLRIPSLQFPSPFFLQKNKKFSQIQIGTSTHIESPFQTTQQQNLHPKEHAHEYSFEIAQADTLHSGIQESTLLAKAPPPYTKIVEEGSQESPELIPLSLRGTPLFFKKSAIVLVLLGIILILGGGVFLLRFNYQFETSRQKEASVFDFAEYEVETLSRPRVVFDAHKKLTHASLPYLVTDSTSFFVLHPETKTILKFSLLGTIEPSLPLPETQDQDIVSLIGFLETNIFLLSNGSETFLLDLASSVLTSISNTVPPLLSPHAYPWTAYVSHIYFLKPQEGSVWKVLIRPDGTNAQSVSWLSKNSKKKPTDAIDIASDGSLYFLFKDGRIQRYWRGSFMEEFTPSINPPLVEAYALYTDTTMPFLWILEQKTSRVALLNKNTGVLVKQFHIPALLNIQDLFVHQDTLFLLDGGSIYSFPIKINK